MIRSDRAAKRDRLKRLGIGVRAWGAVAVPSDGDGIMRLTLIRRLRVAGGAELEPAARGGQARGRGDVDRYEQLRDQALAGAPGGSRLGLALLQDRGVTAWTRAWRTAVPTPIASSPPAVMAGDREIVRVLATMALACATAS